MACGGLNRMDQASSRRLARGKGLWRRISSWFRDVPVADPVDRRNAPMFLFVLLILAVSPPLAWAYRILLSDAAWRPGETASLLLSLCVSAMALAGVLLIRRGYFRFATRSFLLAIALVMMLSHAETGLAAQSHEQPLQVVWIVIAGLVVGRWALWAMYACSVLAMGIGLMVDLGKKSTGVFSVVDESVGILLSAIVLLLLAIVVDRCVAALRESLREATRRGDQLAVANLRLKAEIVEREKAQDRLVHAQKVEAVGRLASGVAHDFNHLLSLILGFARKGHHETDPDALKKALMGVEAAARRATAVSHKLLNFSRQEVAKVETFDARLVIDELKPMLRQLFDPRTSITVDMDPVPHWIAFDRTQFELVVLNIAANANDAMPEGGRFRLHLRMLADAGRVALEMSDSGSGMPPDVQARIFEAFYTTKLPGRGTGLGLAVVHDLVVAAGGTLEVHSEPGQGSRFVIDLPGAMPIT